MRENGLCAMGDMIDINTNKPHRTESVICKRCKYDWQAVFLETTIIDNLQCDQCGEQEAAVFDMTLARDLIRIERKKSTLRIER